MMIVKPVTVFHLEHKTKCRRYHFAVAAGFVLVSRFEGGRSETRPQRLEFDKARALWRWLLKIGYVRW